MPRHKTETRPGLVALYDIRPGNGAGPFLQPRSPHGAVATGNRLQDKLLVQQSEATKRNHRCCVGIVNRLRIGHTQCIQSYLLSSANQPDLSARLVSVHSLSSTSLLNVPILSILTTNALLLSLWRSNWRRITKFDVVTPMGRGLVLGGQPQPCPCPSTPQFQGFSSIYDYTF